MKKTRWMDVVFRLPFLAVGTLALFALTLGVGRFIDSDLELAVILAINPDSPHPILDTLMIFLTDFSVYTFALVVISWEIAYYIVRSHDAWKPVAQKVFWGLGLVLGVYHGLGYWLHDWGIFYWGEYTHKSVFPLLGLTFLVVYGLAGQSFVYWGKATLQNLAGVFWLTILTVILTNPLGEDHLKELVGRPRPLNDFYQPWNAAIRPIADEIVRGGGSYISGHASSLFALLTPLFWAARIPSVRIGIFAWAFIHAWTRVYTAAHFPLDIMMGGLYGFMIGTMVYWTFRWESRQKRPAVAQREEAAE